MRDNKTCLQVVEWGTSRPLLFSTISIPNIVIFIYWANRFTNGSPYAIGSLIACLSCLPVTLVYCDQTVGWIKMKHDMEVGLGPPDHIVLDGNPAAPPQRGTALHFSAHVCCGQTAGWIKMPLGREVGIGQGHIVLDGDPAPSQKGGHSPQFSAHVYCGQTVAHLSYC